MTAPCPLPLEPILLPKVWGGRRLSDLGKPLPPDTMIGESWELADLASTSVSGGGGDAARSVVATGPMRGRTLHHALAEWGTDLLGDARPTADGSFPLLVKYLDAREHLSIQVHPSIDYARQHGESHLKTESWLVIDAEPGAELFIGLKPGATRSDLEHALSDGTVPAIMRSRPAVPGECHTLPSGTVHALGAGVLVAEVQTPSDTTFRLYDWNREYNRPDRALHITPGLICADFDDPPPAVAPGGERRVMADTPYYSIESVRASCKAIDLAHDGSGPVVVMLPRTMGAAIASRSGRFPEVELQRGRTCLVPACLASDSVLRCGPDTEAVVARLG